jgi:hypothetical protein
MEQLKQYNKSPVLEYDNHSKYIITVLPGSILFCLVFFTVPPVFSRALLQYFQLVLCKRIASQAVFTENIIFYNHCCKVGTNPDLLIQYVM